MPKIKEESMDVEKRVECLAREVRELKECTVLSRSFVRHNSSKQVHTASIDSREERLQRCNKRRGESPADKSTPTTKSNIKKKDVQKLLDEATHVYHFRLYGTYLEENMAVPLNPKLRGVEFGELKDNVPVSPGLADFLWIFDEFVRRSKEYRYTSTCHEEGLKKLLEYFQNGKDECTLEESYNYKAKSEPFHNPDLPKN